MDDRIVRQLKLKPEGTNDYRLLIDGQQTDICCRHLDDQTSKFGLVKVKQMLVDFLATRKEFASEPERDAAMELLFKAVQGRASAQLVYGLPPYVKAQVTNVSVSSRDTVRHAVKRTLYAASLRAEQNVPS